MNKIKYGILIFSLLSTACASNIKSDWGCDVANPEKCMNISQADELAINKNKDNSPQVVTPEPTQEPEEHLIMVKSQLLEKPEYLRTPEKLARIWFAPFIDAHGNRHDESIVYIVDENSKWISR